MSKTSSDNTAWNFMLCLYKWAKLLLKMSSVLYVCMSTVTTGVICTCYLFISIISYDLYAFFSGMRTNDLMIKYRQ